MKVCAVFIKGITRLLLTVFQSAFFEDNPQGHLSGLSTVIAEFL